MLFWKPSFSSFLFPGPYWKSTAPPLRSRTSTYSVSLSFLCAPTPPSSSSPTPPTPHTSQTVQFFFLNFHKLRAYGGDGFLTIHTTHLFFNSPPMLKILLILWLFPYVAIDLSAFQHFYRLRTMSRVCFFLSFPWSISNSSMTAGITVRRQGYYVHDIPGKQKYKNSCYFQFYFFFICCVFFFFFLSTGKEEEEEKRKFIYLSLRCDEDAALASSAGDKSWEWADCCVRFISFIFFCLFHSKKAGRVELETRRDQHPTTTTFSVPVVCPLASGNSWTATIRNTWARFWSPPPFIFYSFTQVRVIFFFSPPFWLLSPTVSLDFFFCCFLWYF